MKIAILTRPDDRSPKVLAMGLREMLHNANVQVDIFYEAGMLKRLLPLYKRPRYWQKPVYSRILDKIKFNRHDKSIINQLKAYDIIIFSECIPNAFWRNYYDIELLRKSTNRPIFLYEVYYLENAPYMAKRLMNTQEFFVDRYDGYLYVSEITEIETLPPINAFCIGLNLSYTQLHPNYKKKFVAVVDFAQQGFENYRLEQIEVLNSLNIETIILEQNYTLDQIHAIYQSSTLLFMQSYEAFGVPIAECLACGVQIFTPNAGWPMAWRLNHNPQVHLEGQLADCFTVYKNAEDLRNKLIEFRETFDSILTPQKVFDSFYRNYPTFYSGSITNLNQFLNYLENIDQK